MRKNTVSQKTESQRRRPGSLKRKILLFMIFCWGVPIAILFSFMTFSYRRGIIERTEDLMEDELESAASFASIHIAEAITLCQRPSYEKTWENAWRKFETGQYTKGDYLQEVNSSLKGKFHVGSQFNLYAYYRYGVDNPACFSSRSGVPYKDYVNNIQPYLSDIIYTDSSYPTVKVVDGKLFLVRNLYTTNDYKRYGTLVLELNPTKIFQDVPADIRKNMVVCFNNTNSVIDFSNTDMEDGKSQLLQDLLKSYDGISNQRLVRVENMRYNGYLYQKRQNNYNVGVMFFVSRNELYSGLYEFYVIILVMLLVFIPISFYAVTFLRRQIQMPIDRMLDASRRMESGEMGIVVKGEMPNLEFLHMKESFDRMSAQVKSLFEYAYDENLARKDAQIQALQAQINPHFFNNTLEMMNWQARMSGDTVVSKMIEALGTVLDYRMNRANVKKIHLAEELQCVDAYFYIMSMRFGQRLQIDRDIDEELLYIMVPPLILQPIVENAIVHGVEIVKNSAIHLRVYHDDRNIYLEVRNTSKKIQQEDMERIQAILAGDESKLPRTTGRHTSIGIQNVNRRIQLMYGGEYGLTFVQNEACETISTIKLPYQSAEFGESLKERIEVEQELKNRVRL